MSQCLSPLRSIHPKKENGLCREIWAVFLSWILLEEFQFPKALSNGHANLGQFVPFHFADLLGGFSNTLAACQDTKILMLSQRSDVRRALNL